MSKASKISLLFFLIFLIGLLAFVGIINRSLDKKTEIEFPPVQVDHEQIFTALPNQH